MTHIEVITPEEYNLLTHKEAVWIEDVFTSERHHYIAEPTPAMRIVLARAFGPLDFDIKYV